jgi:hypothetical protein
MVDRELDAVRGLHGIAHARDALFGTTREIRSGTSARLVRVVNFPGNKLAGAWYQESPTVGGGGGGGGGLLIVYFICAAAAAAGPGAQLAFCSRSSSSARARARRRSAT